MARLSEYFGYLDGLKEPEAPLAAHLQREFGIGEKLAEQISQQWQATRGEGSPFERAERANAKC